MTAQNVFFYVIAAFMVFCAVRMVTTKNVVHAALYLVGVLAGIAAQYLLVAAEFLAATQVLVYIGAIIVLILFGVMLTRAKIGQDVDLTNNYWYVGLITAIALMGVTGYSLWDQWGDDKIDAEAAETLVGSNIQQTSDSIFGTYLIPFEALSVLLTAALIGAIVLARKD